MIALFPGQGSQQVGMAKDFFENFRIAKEVFEEASDATHLNLKKLCFDSLESDLKLTSNTQPALLVTSTAIYRVFEAETGLKPKAAAGHSLGEYSALVAAKSISLSSASTFVRARGLAMQSAVPEGKGSMLAIMGLNDEEITLLCNEATRLAKENLSRTNEQETVSTVCEPANYNAPSQTVIAGSTAALATVADVLAKHPTLKEKKTKAIALAVSAPFHCSLMKPASTAMKTLFEKNHFKAGTLSFPYLPNRTARYTTEPTVVRDLLIEQIDHPVLWRQTCETLLREGEKKFVEFGPNQVLSGLVKRGAKNFGIEIETFGIATVEDFKKYCEALK